MSRAMRLFRMALIVSEELLEPSLISRVFPFEAEIRAQLEEVLGIDKVVALVI